VLLLLFCCFVVVLLLCCCSCSCSVAVVVVVCVVVVVLFVLFVLFVSLLLCSCCVVVVLCCCHVFFVIRLLLQKEGKCKPHEGELFVELLPVTSVDRLFVHLHDNVLVAIFSFVQRRSRVVAKLRHAGEFRRSNLPAMRELLPSAALFHLLVDFAGRSPAK